MRSSRDLPRTPGTYPPEGANARAGELATCWLALAGMIAFNAAAEALRLGGTTAAEVSNEVFAWFVPAGYAFSIWGVIYVALVAWLALITRDLARTQGSARVYRQVFSRGAAAAFVASCLLNVVWLAAWHLRALPLTLIAMVALVACVAVLYVKMRREAHVLRWAPVSIYLSWLTAALLANAAHAIARVAPPDAGPWPPLATILAIGLLAFLGLVAYRGLEDWVYPLGIGWAAVAVGVRLLEASPIVGVLCLAIAAIGLAATYLPWERLLGRGDRRPSRR